MLLQYFNITIISNSSFRLDLASVEWWAVVSLCHLRTNSLFSRLPEGVQLLCLIDKAADACRYLQTYGEWNRAAWLAKVALHSKLIQLGENNNFATFGGRFEPFLRLPCHACLSPGAFEPGWELGCFEALGGTPVLPTSQPEIQSHPGAAFSRLLLQSGGDAPQVRTKSCLMSPSLTDLFRAHYSAGNIELVLLCRVKRTPVWRRLTGFSADTTHLFVSVALSPHVCLGNSMRQFDRTALFIEACLKYGVMEANDASNILFENPLLHTELFCLELVPLPALVVCFWTCNTKNFFVQYTLMHPAAFKCSQESITLNNTPWLLQDRLWEQEAILNIEKLLFLSFTVYEQEHTMLFLIEHLLLEFFDCSVKMFCKDPFSFQLRHSCWNILKWNFYLRSTKLTSFPIPAFAHKLIEAAFLDYARLLRSLGLREGAALWASRAGTAGEQLMEELFQGEGGSPETIFGKEQAELVQESTEWPQWQRSCAVVKSETCLCSLIVVRLQEFSLCQLLWNWQSITEDHLYLWLFLTFLICVFLCVCIHTHTYACMYQSQTDTFVPP